MIYNAYWFRYRRPHKEDKNIGVIAKTLDDAFLQIINELGIPNEDIFYLNREIDILHTNN